MNTFYAPGERDPLKEVLQQRGSLDSLDNMKSLLSSLSYIVFILNTKRQIVFANDTLLKKLQMEEDLRLIGLRPGEALKCKHAPEGPQGCGTSKHCRYCANVNVILDVLEHDLPSTQEGRMTVKKGQYETQLDLEVTASPLKFDNSDYIVFSARDITDKKRKELLERTFFHDIINLAGTLDGIMEMMEDMDENDREHFFKSAKRISNSLIEEIQMQQQLVRAENNELEVKPEAYELNELVKGAVSKISFHDVAKNKTINFIPLEGDYGIVTDKVLLHRVLVNLIKNALEASALQGVVTVRVKKGKDRFVFEVHNASCIPDHVQKQLFQRSFSTKGKGRGIGTYSIKLLGERYLKGMINFQSNEASGTTFSLSLPSKI